MSSSGNIILLGSSLYLSLFQDFVSKDVIKIEVNHDDLFNPK